MGYLQDLQGNPIAVRAVIPAPRIIQFVPAQYQKGNATFTFGVNDGAQDSTNVATATLVINHVNHAPSATATSPVTVTRTIAKNINLVVSDFDIGDAITVTITSLAGSGQLFYGSTSITSAPFTLPGTFTVPSSNSITITLSYIAPATASGAAFGSFAFVAKDNGSPALSSASVSVTVSIAQNSIPVANPAGPLNVVQDSTSLPLPLNGTDADVADANNLKVVIMSLPTKGTIRSSGVAISVTGTILTSGTVTYSTTQRAADQFSFAVRDNLNAISAPVTVTTSVTPVNHLPSAFFVGTASANEDSTLVITNMQASDPDGDAVTIYIMQAPSAGIIQQYDGSPCASYPCLVTDPQYRMKFVPALHAWGVPYTTLYFAANDGAAYSATTNGSLNIQFVDYPPVAVSTVVNMKENDQNVQVTFSYSDFDTAAPAITVVITSMPPSSYGTLTTTGGAAISVGDTVASPLTVLFTPAQYIYGNATLSFKAKDAQSFSNVAQVTLNVTHVNHAPSAYFVGTAATNEDSTLIITQIQVTDPDVNDVLTVTVTKAPLVGTLQQYDSSACNVPCQITDPQYRMKFIPDLHGWGNPYASFLFVASDGQLQSAPVNASLNINFVDYPPVASSSALSINENDPATSFNLSYSDFDSLPSAISTTILSLPSANIGRLTTSSGGSIAVGDSVMGFGLVFTPALYSPGSATFSFKVKDALSYSNVASVNINVAHINHAPTAFFVGTAATNEDSQLIITQIRATDRDAGDVLTVSITQPPTVGTLLQYDNTTCASYPCQITDPEYKLRFIPALHGWGNPYASFSFVASDGQLQSTPVTASLNINFVDYAPVASASTVNMKENDPSTQITFSYSDFDSSSSVITATIVSLPSASIGRITTLGGASIAVGDTISTYSVMFVPALYSPGSTSFSFKVRDAQSYSNAATVTVNVAHVNHAPSVFWAGQAIADEDTNLIITQIQISDPDRGDTLTAIVAAPPTKGTLYQLDGTSCSSYPCTVTDSQYRMKFVPVPDGNGIPYTWIQISAYDGALPSSTINVTLNINPVNDAPVASASSVSTDESTTATITLNVADIDTPYNQLSATIQALPQPSIGSLTDLSGNPLSVGSVVANPMRVKFVPVQYANGDTSFSFNANDGQYTSSTVTVSIHINPIVQAPICGVSPASQLIVSFESSTILQLTVFDPDPSEYYSFNLVSISTYANSGTLYDPSNQPITPATTAIASRVKTAQMYGQITLNYTVVTANTAAYVVMQFTVNDGTYTSSPCTLVINSTLNTPPTATDVGMC